MICISRSKWKFSLCMNRMKNATCCCSLFHQPTFLIQSFSYTFYYAITYHISCKSVKLWYNFVSTQTLNVKRIDFKQKGLSDMHKKLLLAEIEKKREELVAAGSKTGLTSAISLQRSMELDVLLNQYSHLYEQKTNSKPLL